MTLDESHFAFELFLRTLPPMPQGLPDQAQQLLRQADECLATNLPELALEAVALLGDWSVDPGHGPVDRPRVAMVLGRYLADLYSQIASRAFEAGPFEPGDDGPRLCLLTPTTDPAVLGGYIEPLARAAQRAGWPVAVVVTHVDAERQPPLQFWQPRTLAHPDKLPFDPATGIQTVELGTNGHLVGAAKTLIRILRDYAPTLAIAVGDLRTPIMHLAYATRIAEVQVQLALSEPCPVDGADAVVTPDALTSEEATLLRSRGIATATWDELQNDLTRWAAFERVNLESPAA